MMTFFKKYKRWIYLLVFAFAFIMLFIPYYQNVVITEGSEPQNIFIGTCRLFEFHSLHSTIISNGFSDDGKIFYYKDYVVSKHDKFLIPVVLGEIFIVAGVLLAIATIIFINKTRKIPYSIPFLLFMFANIIKRKLFFVAWTDYVIITIALLMLIVDIVRLSLYIRAHKDVIRAKAADISARLKTKIQREHKPTKDERIAELEERVRQLEDKKDE